MYYLKPDHICFDTDELQRLFRNQFDNEIERELDKRGYTLDELRGNNAKMQEIADATKGWILKDNALIEMFTALYCFLGFYTKTSKLCFVLKNGFDPIKTPILSLTSLKAAIRQDQEIDFGILIEKTLKEFQLKRYKGSLNTEKLLEFIENKLRHYGCNLGDTNLLILLQCPGENLNQIDFIKLEKKLKTLNLAHAGEVLITFNAENKFNIIKRIYPEAGTAKIPFILPSQQETIN